ncbi:transcription antitermination factor NusB [Candidatus Saccharibacteria bacterium]|nr:transcription antitermination factor NusB [Candidatus Saccharibacteria bacterium]
MASNRHLGRILALQSLYELDFRSEFPQSELDVEEVLDRNVSRYDKTLDDKSFVRKLVYGVFDDTARLDAVLQPIAPEWPIEQIARIDKCILRMALYELLDTDEAYAVPPKVVINEAVELAKAFGSDNSSKFVNGVLGTAYRNLVGADDKPAAAATATTKPDTPEEGTDEKADD